MRAPGVIPDSVRELQRAVSNPAVSAWVAANAGSGKTHVLVQRVINLLLDGVEPEKILCITFTKAAAANMAKRVFDTLAEWTTLDDAGLDKAIRERSNLKSDAARRALARRLFARALDTPGGLKVQTIHAFCTQLLHQFPFEANVAARFTVLDDAEHTQLLEQLTLNVLLEGADAPDGKLGRGLAAAMVAAADQTFRDVVREAIGKRGTIMTAGDLEVALANLAKSLGVDPSDDAAKIEAEYFTHSLIAPSEWSALAKTLAAGNKTDIDQAGRFAGLAALPDAERVVSYLQIFCTGGGTPRKSIVTKAIKDMALVERLCREQERICALLDRRRAVACRDRSSALVTIAYEVLERYLKEKERRGLLDYDDLIDKALALLGNVDAAWVHYKLDLGIDHVLIDEAQDTSKKQWQIVVHLTDEFTAGAGARPYKRTIFPVGDEKQSIYSFQNAAPKEFAEMRRYFERRHTSSGLDFVFRELKHSFRSGESILAAVDLVFKSTEMAASVSSDAGGFPPHLALPDALPGVVEVWEPEKPDERREIEGWDAPFDLVNETSPRVKLARRIARHVRGLIERGAAKSGDVLVLVRQRGPLFEAIIRALKQIGVAVAGADRLILTEHIAVMDLMALADALLLPQDDLALATVLRSPLFGFSDEELFAVAWKRDASLRAALPSKAGENKKFADDATRLDELAQDARRETPFAFYAKLLGAGGARKNFLGRLGVEANDALDEFLNLALDYERRDTPSLQGFVAWLRSAQAEVKRDMEIARDEVRVMTVHGAKGLEAPIVILADTMTPPTGPKPPRLLELSGGAVIWAGRKEDDVPSVAAARDAAKSEAENEYRRLLYVAMTRAADRLIICGADGRTKRPERCWYDLVRGPLEALLVEEDDSGEKVLRFSKAATTVVATSSGTASEKIARREIPAWLRQPAPTEAPGLEPLSPSSAFDDDIALIAPGAGSAADRQKALERGRLVHRLMQALPDIAAERREDAAERYLANAAADFAPAERAAMAKQVLAILDDKDFAEIFAPGSRAEVPIVGRIARAGRGPIPVAGQVDRLAVTGDTVLIADYKTDRIVPDRLDETHPYVTQLALYRAVLARVFPGKTVRAALLFTDGPKLMEMPAETMDKALDAALTKR
ncbi:MAG: double-strand break repair helicase AddA [Xanthobacteraceae bacterium]|jgi:ATP-dependent helicase/nuclease subunit A